MIQQLYLSIYLSIYLFIMIQQLQESVFTTAQNDHGNFQQTHYG